MLYIAGNARAGRQGARRRAARSVAREAALRQEEEGGDPARQGAAHDADDARTRRVRSILSCVLPLVGAFVAYGRTCHH